MVHLHNTHRKQRIHIVLFMDDAEDKTTLLTREDIQLLEQRPRGGQGPHALVHYGVVHYGVVHYGVVHYGMVHYGMVQY